MKNYILLSAFLLFSMVSLAQFEGQAKDTLNCNQIRAAIFPQSSQFYYGDGLPPFNYPADTSTSTVFLQGLWMGGIGPDNELYLAADRYYQNGHDFWSGPFSETGSPGLNHQIASDWFNTWKVTKAEVIDHAQHFDDENYQIPEAILTWPAHGNTEYQQAESLAPFVDVDLDAEYHPEWGDYPLIKGNESVFYMINDHVDHTESGGNSMGVEIHCMAWTYCDSILSESYQYTIFLSYTIINRSDIDYQSTYLGVFADLDIGKADDDFIGCHVENGNFFAYNGDDYDSYYKDKIPTQAVCILGGPYMDADELDNPLGLCDEGINGSGFGDGVVDNERFGMNRFVSFNNSGNTAISDPSIASEYYNLMRGIWKDGTSVLFGGNGHVSSGALGPETRFMYPDGSDSCYWGTNGQEPNNNQSWTEESSANVPGDRRGVAMMGPFTFEAGSIHFLDIALVTARANDEKNSKELLQEYVAAIKADYIENSNGFGNQYLGQEEISQNPEEAIYIFPNPVNGDQFYIELPHAQQSEYYIYNSTGQLIQNGLLSAQKQQQITIANLLSGWYVLEVKMNEDFYRTKLIK